MRRERILAIAAVALLAALVVSAVAVPGVLREPVEDVRPSHVSISEADSTIRVTSVSGESVSLALDTRLVHRGGPSENVTLEVQAIDAQSGLLADRARTSIGDLAGERSYSANTSLALERSGGYELRLLVYSDGERVNRATVPIRGLGALEPDYAASPIRFQRYAESGADVPTVFYRIADDGTDTVTLSVSAALVNGGSAPAGDVSVRVRARQVDSNVIADEATVDVAEIDPGVTVEPTVELTVPAEYNYWLDAVLLDDGVVIGTVSSAAKLDPQATVPTNQTTRDVEFSAGDFTIEDGSGQPDEAPTGGTTDTSGGSGPGFGVPGALAALGGAVLIARRFTQ